MPFIEVDGHLSWVEPELILTDESVAIIRDVLMCVLKARGASWRRIGDVLNTSHSALRERYLRMSPADRCRLETIRLRDLGL